MNVQTIRISNLVKYIASFQTTKIQGNPENFEEQQISEFPGLWSQQ